MTVLDLLMSKILIVIGFIFSNSLSLEPSMPKLNGCWRQCCTIYSWQWGPIALLIMVQVFVHPDEYSFAMLLSGNADLNSGPKWSDIARGKLCWTKKFVVTTSALVTESFFSCNWNNWEIDSWVLISFSLFLCNLVSQWSFTSLMPWWSHFTFFMQGIQWNEYGSFSTAFTAYTRLHSLKFHMISASAYMCGFFFFGLGKLSSGSSSLSSSLAPLSTP